METRTRPRIDSGQVLPLTGLCPHFGVCGGCSSQNVPYENQLKKKEQRVRTHLEKLSVSEFLPIHPSPDVFFYRNKMEFSFGDERDMAILNSSAIPNDGSKVHLGLHPKGRFALVAPTPECQLQSEESQTICQTVSAWASDHQIPVYVRKKNEGVLRHLVIREGKNTGQRMVNLFTSGAMEEDKVTELAERLKKSASIDTFLWTVNDELSDVAQGEVRKNFWGDGVIVEKVHDIELRITPSSFMQTNTHASEQMIRILREWVQPSPSPLPERERARERDVLIDLYCGTGTIGLNLISKFKKLVGIESNEDAVRDARANAVANGILNTEFITGRVEDLTGVLKSIDGLENAVIVVDPPRPGLHAKVSAALLEVAAPSIFYVSCNPESLARDLRLLGAKYKIDRVQPMDFFPHTDHVETVVSLIRS